MAAGALVAHATRWLWNLPGAQAAYPPLWQLSQLAIATPVSVWYGMWLADLAVGRREAPGVAGRARLATVTWVWFQLLGVQPVVLWQLMQLVAPTGMCVPDLPVAVLLLWQLAQLVAAVKAVWSTWAPGPAAGRLVAALAVARDRAVDRVLGLPHRRRVGAGVAARALVAHATRWRGTCAGAQDA